MFSLKTIAILLFCAIFSVVGDTTSNPDPNAKPEPSPDAEACIIELTTAGTVDKCHNQSMAKWDPLRRGEQMGSIREMCCEMYGEINCLINATKNGVHCHNTTEAMMNHQRTLFAWLQRTVCISIKANKGMCDPDQYNRRFPPPQPKAVAQCFDKIYQTRPHCEAKAKKDWKVTTLDSPMSRKVCCSQYETHDCYVNAAKNSCNADEYTQFHKYYHDMNVNISNINCTDHQYQSFECFNPVADFPPPPPPGALNCTGKIFDKMNICSNKATKKWKATLAVLTGENACCANWDVFDCILSDAQDDCTLPELSQFEQYYNYLAQTITNVNCTNYGYHSKPCKSYHNNSRTLQLSWITAATSMILAISIFNN